ncbi:MAG: DUF979 domain-containing protein [Polymorphobacter sp.]
MIGLGSVYTLGGIVFAAIALLSARDRANAKRWGNAAFWGLLALSFLGGSHLGDLGNGVLVLVLVALAGFGAVGRSHPATTDAAARTASAAKLGNRLFVPALAIPVTALAGTLLFKYITVGGVPLVEPRQTTLVSLALGVLVALALATVMLRPPKLAALQEGRRLLDAVGWAAILPQMLAALGGVFALAGVGDVVGQGVSAVIPDGNLFAAVAAYTLGMALFTCVMGNAFAAFPVMTAAVALPLLVHGYGGNPAIITAIGMLSGFCGTLCTPMAANFNIVPATLLELDDRNGVIKAQVATALPLLAINTLLIYGLAFR